MCQTAAILNNKARQRSKFNDFTIIGMVREPSHLLVVLRLNVPVNNFSVMSGRSHRFLGN